MRGLLIAYPVYLVPPGTGLDRDTERWLLGQNADGPLAMEDVTDVCAALKVEAIVTSEEGLVLCLVGTDGRLRPSQPPKGAS